jgi:hypothetical protein
MRPPLEPIPVSSLIRLSLAAQVMRLAARPTASAKIHARAAGALGTVGAETDPVDDVIEGSFERVDSWYFWRGDH